MTNSINAKRRAMSLQNSLIAITLGGIEIYFLTLFVRWMVEVKLAVADEVESNPVVVVVVVVEVVVVVVVVVVIEVVVGMAVEEVDVVSMAISVA